VPVPGRDQHRAEVQAELKELLKIGTTMVVPVTAVIECGNFIAQLNGSADRRSVAQRFVRILQMVRDGESPWVFNNANWSREFWDRLLAGASTGEDLLGLLTRRVGTGDVAIIAERDDYRDRSGLENVRIWTRDVQLAAHS